MKLSSKFKSYFIFFGAVIGFFVAIVFFNDFDSSGGDKAKLVVYGIGFGGLAGYFISSILLIFGQSGHFLIKKFKKLGNFKDMPIEDVVKAIGVIPTRQPVNITDRNEKGYFYTFKQGDYSVKILVGADGKCIRLEEEVLAGKKLQ